MEPPGVTIETLDDPARYALSQIARARSIARMLNRGKLVLVEPPGHGRR